MLKSWILFCSLFMFLPNEVLAQDFNGPNNLDQPPMDYSLPGSTQRPTDQEIYAICTNPYTNDKPDYCYGGTGNNSEEGRGRAAPGGAQSANSEPDPDPDAPTATACGTAYANAKSKCRGAVLAEKGAVLSQLGSTLAMAQSTGNTRKSCELAGQINALTGGLNAAVGATCAYAVKGCKESCDVLKFAEPNTTLIDGTLSVTRASRECLALDATASSAIGQVVQSAIAVMASQACVKAASGECSGENAFTNPDCTEFCFKAVNANHSKCLTASAQCSNPNYAAQNVQYCTCLANPLSPSCRSAIGTVPTSTAGTAPNLGEDGIGSGEYDFGGVNPNGSAANVKTPEGGGGGFGGGGGGSSAFGDNGGGGSGDDPLNKEILAGTGGAAGGAGGFFGGGGYGEGNSKNGGGGKSGEEKGLDLSQFLPGGKKDPTRNPASAGYGDPTITKANGLTNWQKVTRKINEKRPELMP